MAYRQQELHQSKSHNYDKMFHQNTGVDSANNVKKIKGNRRILDYHLYSGQYEQNQQNPFGDAFNGFDENAKQNRQEFQSSMGSVNEFNNNIDKMHKPFDIQRPVATRDQVKSQYETENKSLYTHTQRNEYFNQHQFMPGQTGSMNANRFDFYSMQNPNDEKQNGFEDFF